MKEDQSKYELVIIPKAGGYAMEITSAKEYYGYGRQILLVEEAQRELIGYLWKHKRDLVDEITKGNGK